LFDRLHGSGQRNEVAKLYAAAKTHKCVSGGRTFHLRAIRLGSFARRIAYPVLQSAVIRKCDKAFTVRVQSSGRVKPRHVDKVFQRRPAEARNWHKTPYGLLNRMTRLMPSSVQKKSPRLRGF
jgi:hypothetical protein